MAAPLYTLGDIVRPLTAVFDPDTRLLLARLRVAGGRFVDAQGRHTDLALVLDPIPTMTSTWTFTTWVPEKSATTTVAVSTFVYRLRVWDIDAQAFVELDYPEASLYVPPNTHTRSSARHYDADAVDDEMALIAAAYRATSPG